MCNIKITGGLHPSFLYKKRGDNTTINHSTYHEMSLVDFFRFIGWESEKNDHHVFPERFIKGAYNTMGLSQKGIQEEFGISLMEIKKIPISAHCFYNDLFDNDSPPAVLVKLAMMVNDGFSSRQRKKLFVKFCLCALKEKFSVMNQTEKFEELSAAVENIEEDLKYKNKLTIKQILDKIGLTKINIEYYLENFFPENWKYLNASMWSCYVKK